MSDFLLFHTQTVLRPDFEKRLFVAPVSGNYKKPEAIAAKLAENIQDAKDNAATSPFASIVDRVHFIRCLPNIDNDWYAKVRTPTAVQFNASLEDEHITDATLFVGFGPLAQLRHIAVTVLTGNHEVDARLVAAIHNGAYLDPYKLLVGSEISYPIAVGLPLLLPHLATVDMAQLLTTPELALQALVLLTQRLLLTFPALEHVSRIG